MKKIKYTFLSLILLLGFGSCESYLEEDNPSGVTADTYYNEDNADELVVAAYSKLRAVYREMYDISFYGTDVYCIQSVNEGLYELNDYVGLGSSNNSVQDYWVANYNLISAANVIYTRYTEHISWGEYNYDARDLGIAQAKALRALGYYNLVQQFGGVVLYLDEVEELRYDYERATEEATINQIIQDLEEAIPDLESYPEQFGRFSKRAAQHLLADVYVTRAYKDYGSASDFETAAALAESAIDGYDIRNQSYGEVFDYNNQENDEILLSVQYGSGTDPDNFTNDKHAILMNDISQYIGITRGSPYGLVKGGFQPTAHFYDLLADNDERDEATLHRVLFADDTTGDTSWTNSETNEVDVVVAGDTVIYYPKETLDADDLADKLDRYWVYQPVSTNYYRDGQYIPEDIEGALYQYSQRALGTNFPIFKKFDDQNINESSEGHRDTFVFRVAETHLLAAEAYLGAGDTGSALTHINRVRERATGETNYYASVNIDDILDERAIELAGEENRWNILKRTGKLQERMNLYNPQIQDHGGFNPDIHLVRPIPALELDASDGSLEQNPGY